MNRACSPTAIQGLRVDPTFPGSKQTVVIVEAHAMVRTLIYETLMAHGYIATAADDLHEAFTVCRDFEFPIHLIVADMSGRASLGLPQLHLGMASFIDMKLLLLIDPLGVAKESVREAIGYPYLEKPFTPTELVRKIEEIFTREQGAGHQNILSPLEHGRHGRT